MKEMCFPDQFFVSKKLFIFFVMNITQGYDFQELML